MRSAHYDLATAFLSVVNGSSKSPVRPYWMADRMSHKQFVLGRAIRSGFVAVHLTVAPLLTLGCGDPSAPAVPTPAEASPQAPLPPIPSTSTLYVLKRVSDQPLPVKCPYGTGEWDYDADAGTWQLIEASIALNIDGTYTNDLVARAKSGRTSSQRFSGSYTRTSPSTLQFHANGGTTSATVSAERLTWDWGSGTVLTFER